jgi:putative addiction module component (TIGR02574 family)
MDLSATLEEIKKLDVSDRLWLAHAIWESVGDDALPGELTDEQKGDLEGRMKELDENPAIGLTWDEIKARRRSRR